MSRSRAAGGHAMGAARALSGAARHAAFDAGQAAAVAHVAAHELGAAAYAIKAARAGGPGCEGESASRFECRWQREQLPDAIRELVLEDQRLRNEICWSVFDCSGHDGCLHCPTGALTRRSVRQPARRGYSIWSATRASRHSCCCHRRHAGTLRPTRTYLRIIRCFASTRRFLVVECWFVSTTNS